MDFKVQIVDDAQNDIDEAVRSIFQQSPRHAPKWLSGLTAAILGLSRKPMRFALIAESTELNRLIRSLPYYSHRIIYEVDEAQQVVSILRIYHSARAPLNLGDIDPKE